MPPNVDQKNIGVKSDVRLRQRVALLERVHVTAFHIMRVRKPKRHLHRHFLYQWREFRNLTQEKAAPKLGLSRSQLSKIESGRTQYSQTLLEAAADAYECTVADLIMHDPSNPASPWKLISSLAQATPEQQELALRVLRELLGERPQPR